MQKISYIFYTSEGFTQDPNGNEICNCQMLGIASGVNAEDALNNLLSENEWIEEDGFSKSEIISKKLAKDEN